MKFNSVFELIVVGVWIVLKRAGILMPEVMSIIARCFWASLAA